MEYKTYIIRYCQQYHNLEFYNSSRRFPELLPIYTLPYIIVSAQNDEEAIDLFLADFPRILRTDIAEISEYTELYIQRNNIKIQEFEDMVKKDSEVRLQRLKSQK